MGDNVEVLLEAMTPLDMSILQVLGKRQLDPCVARQQDTQQSSLLGS